MTESLIDTLPSPTPGLEPGLIARLAADLGSAGMSTIDMMQPDSARCAFMRNQGFLPFANFRGKIPQLRC